jgi:hypothetical protein
MSGPGLPLGSQCSTFLIVHMRLDAALAVAVPAKCQTSALRWRHAAETGDAMGEATLKIKGVTQDLTDPRGLRFVLQFTRDLTPVEREVVPQVLTLRFGLPTEENGPDTVMIHNASKGWFTLPHHRKRLKEAVAESEVVAEKHLAQIGSAEGRAAARAEETSRELAAIDWDDNDSLAEPTAGG